MMRLLTGLVRIPDVSFVLGTLAQVVWGNSTDRPDLAVEILSESNTPREMERKLREYFEAGTQLVWYVDPRAQTVTVYSAPDRFIVLDESQTLDGGRVLPGLEIPLRELFDRASRRGSPRE